jgi:hypothetical protein
MVTRASVTEVIDWPIFPFSLPVVDQHDKGTSDPEGTLLF